MKDKTLNQIIEELKKQTDYDFFYNSEMAKSKGKLTVQVKDKEVKEFLDEILPKLGLEYAISQNLISIREKKTIQLINITGKITDEDGNPIMVYHARKEAEIEGNPLYNPNRHAMLMKIRWQDGRPVFGFDEQDCR